MEKSLQTQGDWKARVQEIQGLQYGSSFKINLEDGSARGQALEPVIQSQIPQRANLFLA